MLCLYFFTFDRTILTCQKFGKELTVTDALMAGWTCHNNRKASLLTTKNYMKIRASCPRHGTLKEITKQIKNHLDLQKDRQTNCNHRKA